MIEQSTMNFVLSMLAVATAVSPIIFGFALWKMSQHFVTKEQFQDWKIQTEIERADLRGRLAQIEKNTLELLQRTASHRVKSNED